MAITRYVEGRRRLKPPGHYLVHPTPPWSHKSQYHGHEWTTYMPFVPCQLTIPFLRALKLWPWNCEVKNLGCGQRESLYSRQTIFLIRFLIISHQSDQHSLRYSYFENWLWKSNVKVMSEVKGQDHIIYAVSNRCTSFSFLINRTNHSWATAKRVFDLGKNTFQFLK